MNIGQAITELQRGNRVARAGWGGKKTWLALQLPGELSKMSRPYIYMYTVDRDLVPWVATQLDLLAADWFVVDAG